MAVNPMFDARFAGPPGMLAANADRDRAIDVLKAGFAEGRLTEAEYGYRAARVYSSRTYGELGAVVADLPAGPLAGAAQYAGPVYPALLMRPPVNSSAVGAITCGLAAFLTLGLSGIPAIVLGQRARREIRVTGQRGEGMALAGMMLGWAGVALTALFIVGMVAVSVGSHSGRPVYTTPVIEKPVPPPPIPVKPGPPADYPGGPVQDGAVNG